MAGDGCGWSSRLVVAKTRATRRLDERQLRVTFRPNRTLHRCPSIGPVLLHELTFRTLRSSWQRRLLRGPALEDAAYAQAGGTGEPGAAAVVIISAARPNAA
jgi:hypothetical protein